MRVEQRRQALCGRVWRGANDHWHVLSQHIRCVGGDGAYVPRHIHERQQLLHEAVHGLERGPVVRAVGVVDELLACTESQRAWVNVGAGQLVQVAA